jgi:hypothetical protein
MVNEFTPVTEGIIALVREWEPRLIALPEDMISRRKNRQDRSIRQILGHLIDSGSNNIHRIVHLQYQESPLIFPNYASHGNNDRWIAIQGYQQEDWNTIVNLWKYSNLHLVHVINHIDPSKLDQQWQSGEGKLIPLRDMIPYYLTHLKLHLTEIEELMDNSS